MPICPASLKIFVILIIPFFCGESKGGRKSVTKKPRQKATQSSAVVYLILAIDTDIIIT